MKRIALTILLVGCFGCKGTATSSMAEDDANSVDVTESNDSGNENNTQNDAGRDVTTNDDVSTQIDLSNGDVAIDVADFANPIVGSAGCNVGAGIPEGENTFDLGNRTRRYIMRLPNNYTNEKAWPIVFALHGNGGSANEWDTDQGIKNIRALLEDEAILVVTEAIDGQWRDYSMDASTYPARMDEELEYFETIISRVKEDLCIDETEIFSMGFSGGGSFSGVLGCRRTDIRAMAVGGSVIYFDGADCVGQPAAWIDISEGDLSAGREAYRDYFRDLAGCDETSTAAVPDQCVQYDNCDPGKPVQFCTQPGGHAWPDFGSEAMWDFFKTFIDAE